MTGFLRNHDTRVIEQGAKNTMNKKLEASKICYTVLLKVQKQYVEAEKKPLAREIGRIAETLRKRIVKIEQGD